MNEQEPSPGKRFLQQLYEQHQAEPVSMPSAEQAAQWLNQLIHFLFPHETPGRQRAYEVIMKRNRIELEAILCSYLDPAGYRVTGLTDAFYDSLSTIYGHLRLDADEIYNNDPAAASVSEVVVSYPGFYAIAVYRMAHRLAGLGIPVLPRVLSEYAHSRTGIDIHPKARIGVPFFIDHGTGVVIGETTIIGRHVKIYQGVTLGALHVSKELSNTKRHPTIEDNVIIYAHSTILGGNTVIGNNSVIGGNVFLVHSVDPYCFVYNTHEVKVRSQSDNSNALNFTI
jgi:serine O-acetyltransferase